MMREGEREGEREGNREGKREGKREGEGRRRWGREREREREDEINKMGKGGGGERTYNSYEYHCLHCKPYTHSCHGDSMSSVCLIKLFKKTYFNVHLYSRGGHTQKHREGSSKTSQNTTQFGGEEAQSPRSW